MSSLYHFNKPNVVDIRRNIYEGYPQLENVPLVQDDHDHENEDVNKNYDDLTESTVDTEETTDDKSSNQGREFRDDWIIWNTLL